MQNIDLDQLKEKVITEVDQLRQTLKEVSDAIHQNPELGYEEYKASDLLARELENSGMTVERDFLGMPTAFKATYTNDLSESKEGEIYSPTIAFLAEYDALPNIGHACGHNLIGTMSLGAAISLVKIMKAHPNIKGTVTVIGTPAEETSGAKVTMVDRGIFDDIDAAMMIHPRDLNIIRGPSLAMDAIEFEYTGQSSQATVAWEGKNALDGVLQLFNSVNGLRLRLRPDVRVHGIITEGGTAANIIPDKAVARFYVRGKERKALNQVVEQIKNCARGAELASETELKIRNYEFSFENMVPNEPLASTFEQNLHSLGVTDIISSYDSYGSTDMGNVSHKIPAIHPYLAIGPVGTYTHTKDFAEAAVSDKAHNALVIGAKTLALTGLEVLLDSDLRTRIKSEHQSNFQ